MTDPKPTPEELEKAADEILAQDIREFGFDGKILLRHHLCERRKHEVYANSGVVDPSLSNLKKRNRGDMDEQ